MAQSATAMDASKVALSSVTEFGQICEELAATPAGEPQKIAAVFLKATIPFYDDVRKQARQSFNSALFAAIVGVVFFVFALYRSTVHSPMASINISVIAGTLVQVIAGINFYLYANVSKQFFAFHACLERIDRFMIANSLCEHLGANKKDEVRAELVRTISSAPLLTLDLLSGKSGKHSGDQALKSRTLQKAAAAGSPTS